MSLTIEGNTPDPIILNEIKPIPAGELSDVVSQLLRGRNYSLMTRPIGISGMEWTCLMLFLK